MSAAKKMNQSPEMVSNQEILKIQQEVIHNAFAFRRDWVKLLTDPKRDIDGECGYPDSISEEIYVQYWQRHGIANRVVGFYPEECWKQDPEVYEVEDAFEETPFEKRWKELVASLNLYSILERIDVLSGVGSYGVVLIGIDDGKTLDKPIEGCDTWEDPRIPEDQKKGPKDRTILYLRCFQQKLAPIHTWEQNTNSPRFGKPLTYNLMFSDPRNEQSGMPASTTGTPLSVHWSRILHICDNRSSSEIIGTSRMESVFNNLYDLKKVTGGAAEMFWKGGFPGLSFEVDPTLSAENEFDEEAKKKMREEMADYANSLSRFMATVGVKVNSLAPQVASPKDHFDAGINSICIAKSVPKRVFMGSERGELASTQDKESWNERLNRRRSRYVTPFILRPCVRRFIYMGVIVRPKDIFVDWPDLNAPSDDNIAATAERLVRAMAQYLGQGCDKIMAPLDFFMKVLKMEQKEAKAVLDAALEYLKTKKEETPTVQEEEKITITGGEGGTQTKTRTLTRTGAGGGPSSNGKGNGEMFRGAGPKKSATNK